MSSNCDEASTSGDATTATVKQTILQYYGAGNARCGYCKRDTDPDDTLSGRSSYDMTAETITASDYQTLLDRGWRRSGDYCYHPINSKTCCPNYPIICDALNFKLSKSQRNCIKNLNSYLIGNKGNLNYGHKLEQNQNKLRPTFEQLKASVKARDKRFVVSIERKVRLYGVSHEEAIRQLEEKKSSRMPNLNASLEDYLFPRISCIALQPEHKLQIRMHHVDSKEAESMREDENKLIQRYQMAIHKEEASLWGMSRYCDFLVDSPIIIEEMKNFRHAIRVANSSCDILAKSVTPDNNSEHLLLQPPELPTSYGTYHCVYLLNGKLIAVGVLDVLPKCITTVYFFYDPDYGHLNLGIYSALIEISMIRQLVKQYYGPANENRLTHYYLGFYVHECEKMRYKTKFRPSSLLCSETFQYVPTELCLSKLRGRKYARFCDDPNNKFNVHTDYDSLKNIWKIPVITPVTKTADVMDYFNWLNQHFGNGYDDLLINHFLVSFVRLIGSELLERIHLKLDAIHRALEQRHRKQSQRVSKSESK